MKLKATPPKPVESSAPADDKVAAFIGAATAATPAPAPQQQTTPKKAITPPWSAAHVRPELLVQLNARIPEPLALKLKHVSAMTDEQKQDLVAKALEPYLDARLRELGYEDADL
jgi:hypothetical protein